MNHQSIAVRIVPFAAAPEWTVPQAMNRPPRGNLRGSRQRFLDTHLFMRVLREEGGEEGNTRAL